MKTLIQMCIAAILVASGELSAGEFSLMHCKIKNGPSDLNISKTAKNVTFQFTSIYPKSASQAADFLLSDMAVKNRESTIISMQMTFPTGDCVTRDGGFYCGANWNGGVGLIENLFVQMIGKNGQLEFPSSAIARGGIGLLFNTDDRTTATLNMSLFDPNLGAGDAYEFLSECLVK